MQPYFSVIVPVYNIAAYLEQCVQSILDAVEQTDEMILVCGNSNDGSNELSAALQEKYTNVRMIAQNGIGPSNARNCGLKQAKGQYVLFLDGDDFVDAEVMRDLLCDIRNEKYEFDVLVADFYRYKQGVGQTAKIQQFGEQYIGGIDRIIDTLHPRECFWNIWRYIYRRDFLCQNEIAFWENAYAEDLDFTVKVFLTNPIACFVPMAYYHYRLGREGSLMNQTPIERVLSTLTVIESDINLLKASNASWKQKIIDTLQFEYILNLALICELPRGQQKQALRVAKQEILYPTGDRIVHAIRCMIRVLGIRATAAILSQMKRMKRKKEGRTL